MYVADFHAGEAITVRQLLTHTCKLPAPSSEGPEPTPYQGEPNALDESNALPLANVDWGVHPRRGAGGGVEPQPRVVVAAGQGRTQIRRSAASRR